MIEMKLTPDPRNLHQNILELKIKAPAASEPAETPVEQIPTLIHIDDSIDDDQLPLINHALTDTINRITWPNQIQLATKHQLPNHLETIDLNKDDMFQAAEAQGHCNLIIITNNETKELRKQIAKATEFLTKTSIVQPTTTIELIDSLNDHIKPLKQKTIVNIKIEIELPSEDDTIKPFDFLPNITKERNKYFVNLIDLASEEEKAYAFKTQSPEMRVQYSYDDLALTRRIQGGQSLTY